MAVICVKDNVKLNEDIVRNYVKEETAKYGITKVEVFVLDQLDGKTTYQTIKHHLKYEASDESVHGYIDFVAVGNGGATFDTLDTKNYLGQVSNAIMRARRMNVIFVA